MAERVVDIFKTIEVEEEQSDAGFVPGSVLERCAQTLLKEDALRQTCQRVVIGKRAHVRARATHFSEVVRFFDVEKDGAGMLASVEDRNRCDLDRHERAVL